MYKSKETHLHDSLFRRIRARKATIFTSFYLLHSSSLQEQTPFRLLFYKSWNRQLLPQATTPVNTNTTEDFSKLILPLVHIEGIVCFFLLYQSFPGIFVCKPELYPHVSCVSQQVQEPWKKHDFGSLYIKYYFLQLSNILDLGFTKLVASNLEIKLRFRLKQEPLLVCII